MILARKAKQVEESSLQTNALCSSRSVDLPKYSCIGEQLAIPLINSANVSYIATATETATVCAPLSPQVRKKQTADSMSSALCLDFRALLCFAVCFALAISCVTKKRKARKLRNGNNSSATRFQCAAFASKRRAFNRANLKATCALSTLQIAVCCLLCNSQLASRNLKAAKERRSAKVWAQKVAHFICCFFCEICVLKLQTFHRNSSFSRLAKRLPVASVCRASGGEFSSLGLQVQIALSASSFLRDSANKLNCCVAAMTSKRSAGGLLARVWTCESQASKCQCEFV